MTIYIGYVDVPHGTYDEWRNTTNSNGYNIDNSYGCQCWDFSSLFWRNIGFPAGYPHITSSSAYTMWGLRDQNVAYGGVTYFDLVYNINEVKRGDIMVFNYNSSNPYGHVGFADEDFATWTPDPTKPYEFPILSENNGGTPDPQGGAVTNIHGYDYRLFLGAFRYRDWNVTPTPTEEITKSKFPWVLYSNKIRNRY